jgi:hypothetical protein
MKIRPEHGLQLFHCTRSRRGLNQTLNYPFHAYAFFYSLFCIRRQVWCLYRMIHLKQNPRKYITAETPTSAPQNMVKRTQRNAEHFTMFSKQSLKFYVQRDISYNAYYYFCRILNRSHCSCRMWLWQIARFSYVEMWWKVVMFSFRNLDVKIRSLSSDSLVG